MPPDRPNPPLHVVILAAQRPGVLDPLAAIHRVSHKCLIPLLGRPLIAHVLETLATHRRVAEVSISIERSMTAQVMRVVAMLPVGHAPVHCVASAFNLADSVIAATEGRDGPTLITTADNALLGAEAIDAMADALEAGNDVAIAMARRASVLAAHPDGQRRFYRFADDEYSNCNLYALRGRHALAAAEIFRGGGQFARKAMRAAHAFGIVNLLLLRFRLISLRGGLNRVSRRIGLSIAPVILTDGRHAIDVDNLRTYEVVEALLSRGALAARDDDRAGHGSREHRVEAQNSG